MHKNSLNVTPLPHLARFYEYANEPLLPSLTGWRYHTLIWLVARSFVTSETPAISKRVFEPVFGSLQF